MRLDEESDEDRGTEVGRSCSAWWALGKGLESTLNAMVGPQSILRKKIPESDWDF